MAASGVTLALEEIHSIYTSELTIGLQKMRHDRRLCDSVLECSGVEFPVHGIILCVGSPYFGNKFSNSGHFPSRLELPPTIEPNALEVILIYLYTGTIQNLQDRVTSLPSILRTAEFFQLPILYEYCWNVAISSLTTDTFAELWCVANECGDTEIVSSLMSFMVQNFSKIIETGDFLLLSFRQFRLLLEQIRSKHQSPDLIVRGILNWVRGNVAGRQIHLQELFSRVDLRLLSNHYFKTLIKEDDLIKTSPEVYNNLVAVAMDRLHIESSHSFKNLRMVTFTYDEGRPSELKQCNLETQTWSWQRSTPLNLSYGTVVAYLHDYMYFFGGGREPQDASEMVLIYNIDQNSVVCTTTMSTLRFRPGVVALQNKLYVIGGANASGNLRDVERYDPSTDSWSKMASTCTHHSSPNVVAVENVIYVIGSWNCNNFERYNVTTDSWTVVTGAPSISNYISPSVTTCRGKIYLVRDLQDKHFHIFDPSTEDWATIPFGMGPDFAVRDIWHIINENKPFIFVLTRENELFSFNCLEAKMETCLTAPIDFPVKQALTLFAIMP